jgi:2'-5' RNA ligase
VLLAAHGTEGFLIEAGDAVSNPGQRLRLFVASFLPAVDAEYYDRLMAAMVAQYPDTLRPIPIRSAHFTHAFLGEVTDPSPIDLAQDIENAIAGRRRIAIELGPPTVLRVGGAPRLIMAPVLKGADQLTALSEALVRRLRTRPALATLEFAKAPHVTLARLERRSLKSKRDHMMDTLRSSGAQARISSQITGVDLVRSLLTPHGPRYQALVHHPLA